MLVSIIIPVYNASSYIQRCLDCCLAQTCPNFEVICVDDGSTDGSGAILDEYAKKYSNVKVVHQSNAGVVAARNKAIAEASGEFCYFLDSDDWLPETALEDLLSVADNDTDIVFGNQAVVYAERTEERRLLPQTDLNGLDYVNESLRWINGCIGGKMFRTSVCRKLAIDNSMRLNEDLLMNIQAGTMARKVRRIDAVNYFYNWAHDGSLSKSQSDDSFRSVIAANRRISELLRSRREYCSILKDGYVAYLQKNIISAISRKHLPEESFLVREAFLVIISSTYKYFSFAKRFGVLRLSVLLAPFGLCIPRLWRISMIKLVRLVRNH